MNSRSIRTSSRTCSASWVRPAASSTARVSSASVANAPTLRSGRVWSNARPSVAGSPCRRGWRGGHATDANHSRRACRRGRSGRAGHVARIGAGTLDVPARCVATRLRLRRRARPRRRRRSSPRRRALPRRLPRRRPRTPALSAASIKIAASVAFSTASSCSASAATASSIASSPACSEASSSRRSCPTPLGGQRMVRAGHPGAVRVNPQPGARWSGHGRLPRLGPHGPIVDPHRRADAPCEDRRAAPAPTGSAHRGRPRLPPDRRAGSGPPGSEPGAPGTACRVDRSRRRPRSNPGSLDRPVLGDARHPPSGRGRGSRLAGAARDRTTDRERSPAPAARGRHRQPAGEGGPVDRADARARRATTAVGDRLNDCRTKGSAPRDRRSHTSCGSRPRRARSATGPIAEGSAVSCSPAIGSGERRRRWIRLTRSTSSPCATSARTLLPSPRTSRPGRGSPPPKRAAPGAASMIDWSRKRRIAVRGGRCGTRSRHRRTTWSGSCPPSTSTSWGGRTGS